MPWNLLFGVFGSEISFAVKKENGWDHFHGVAISPLPSFWLYYFNERIYLYKYGDKLKLLSIYDSFFKPVQMRYWIMV